MSRLSTFLLLALLSPGPSAPVQSPNTVTRESTTTAKVDRIERSSRVVTLRSDDNVFQTLYVDPQVKGFDTLKVGDVVTVRYTESVIVQVRPNAKPTAAQDTTEEARKAGNEQVVEQQKVTVTIERIDSQRLFVTYRTHDNRQIVHAVRDKKLLDGVREGDRVEITVTRARAVSIEPRR
jgi:Cu/Ag efflux protein CusF